MGDDETGPGITTEDEEEEDETDKSQNEEEKQEESDGEQFHPPVEEIEEDDGLVHDLSYYVQKIAKNLDETDKDPDEDNGVFESDSEDDVQTEQPVDGDVLRPRQLRSLQTTVKKSAAFHEHRLRLCKTVCMARHKSFVSVDSIADFRYLRCIDFGKNYLRDLTSFAELPFLGTLKLYKNGMGDIATLKSRTLRFLDVTRNKIKTLDGSSLPRLSRLKLNFNRARSLSFLKEQDVKWLRKLELRGNRLKSTAGIRHQFLEELYLAENDIREVEDLEFCPNLRRLHLRDNQIIEVAGFSKRSAKLEYVNLRNNLITFIDDAVGVSVLPKLKTLVMLDNPVQLEEDFRMVLIARMPTLKTLDKVPISAYDRDYSIMLLLDCLHHEEVDLMVAVGDLMEKLPEVDKNEHVISFDTQGSLVSDTKNNDLDVDTGAVSSKLEERDESDSVEEAEDDLDREYWGEKEHATDGEDVSEAEGEDET